MYVANPLNVICAYNATKTAKGEYDASVKEEESQPHTTGSVFQGLRADVNGCVSGQYEALFDILFDILTSGQHRFCAGVHCG